ncbi:molybdopterin synthase sulfur carrier subunit [Colwellia chukchiensis]|uniref:Molybdopterin synthase sulfur carrier subunit n=1 Tax=Colwellia chukchiensis TaxID=641665 RepID=A0A1H7KK88_9GAMM|nr:molybdopterin synthase sulfur carrier subunit [Colwellia chukchiensis]SEK86924.1 molybdopterin synthase sulfur carrier subunit [Colwellia chukchiensis]
MIKVLFFARLREQLATDSLQLAVTENMTTEHIRQQLAQKGATWAQVMSADTLLVAVNQEITDWSHSVNSGDEVAFFPPVTGG